LGDPFRVIRLEGDFVLVRQPDRSIGWVALPDLSEAQGEVVDFTAALISYLRGDFEPYFTRVRTQRRKASCATTRHCSRRYQGSDGETESTPCGQRSAQSLFAVRGPCHRIYTF
jgi:hypothetical protein